MIKSLFSIFQESANSFEGQKEGEKVLLLLRQHLFNVSVRVGFFTVAGLVPVVAGSMFLSYISAYGWLDFFLFVSSIWYLGLWLAIFHVLTIYTLNIVIITDSRIIDSDQRGLFNQKISELHSHRIQDVSTHTNGFVETMLRFGDVTVQTAASEKHFVFHQIPRPDKVKDIIMQITASSHTGVKANLQTKQDGENHWDI
ncbi:MAG: PH domain-containing protein [bacterium]|nr:PH domain-containing protein [bacterium]